MCSSLDGLWLAARKRQFGAHRNGQWVRSENLRGPTRSGRLQVERPVWIRLGPLGFSTGRSCGLRQVMMRLETVCTHQEAASQCWCVPYLLPRGAVGPCRQVKRAGWRSPSPVSLPRIAPGMLCPRTAATGDLIGRHPESWRLPWWHGTAGTVTDRS